jgi:hypothetical protein
MTDPCPPEKRSPMEHERDDLTPEAVERRIETEKRRLENMRYLKDYQTTIPLNERPDLNDVTENVMLIRMIDFAKRNPGLFEQLDQLATKGPLWDGDVISKSDRSDLLRIGACEKVVVNGEQGYNACTYFGWDLRRVYQWMRS